MTRSVTYRAAGGGLPSRNGGEPKDIRRDTALPHARAIRESSLHEEKRPPRKASPARGSWLAGVGSRKAVRLFGKRRRPRNGVSRKPKASGEQSVVADDAMRGKAKS